jgi:hypothetical protein
MSNEQTNYVSKGSLRSLDEAISEVERELQVRRRCYDRWIGDGKMSRIDAQDRFSRLAAAFKYLALVPQQAAEALQKELGSQPF